MNGLAGKIQEAELQVMRVLWEAGTPVALTDIRRILTERRDWDDSTTKTLLRRLQTKGVVRLEKRGVYAPIVTEAEYREWSTQALLDKLYQGSAKQLIATLVSGGSLKDEDIEELRAMLMGRDGDA